MSGSTSTVTLDTPVDDGKSWLLVSYSTEYPQITRMFAKAELSDISDGQYTKISFERGDSFSNVYVSWEVISGDEFTVQTGETSMQGSTSETETITEVDTDKSFVVLSTKGVGTGTGLQYVPRAYLSDSTTLTLNCSASDSSDYTIARWYVVEWSGANVQSGTLSQTGVDTDVTITAVDLSKSFLLFNYSGPSFNTSSVNHISGNLTSTTNINFERGGISITISGTNYISWFVISHDGLSVQSGDVSITGTSSTDTITSVNLEVDYIAYTHTQELTDSTTVSIERFNGDDTLSSYYYVVTETPNIKGTVTLDGTAKENVTIRCIRQSDNTIVDTTTSDSDGKYQFNDLNTAETYHIGFVEYESGGTKYTAKTLYDITPK